MAKFLSIPVTSQPNALIGLNGIKTILKDSIADLTTLITYNDGTVTTLTHAADADYSMQTALNAAVDLAFKQSWQKPVVEITVPRAISLVANA